MDFRFVYITCKNRDEAHKIGMQLVQARLAACANILPGMESIYRWEGKLVSDQEVVLIAKTEVASLQALHDKVYELHSYEVPCIISLPIVSGNEPYLNWLAEQIDRGDDSD